MQEQQQTSEPRDFSAEIKDWRKEGEKKVSKVMVQFENGTLAEFKNLDEARRAMSEEKPETIH